MSSWSLWNLFSFSLNFPWHHQVCSCRLTRLPFLSLPLCSPDLLPFSFCLSPIVEFSKCTFPLPDSSICLPARVECWPSSSVSPPPACEAKGNSYVVTWIWWKLSLHSFLLLSWNCFITCLANCFSSHGVIGGWWVKCMSSVWTANRKSWSAEGGEY